MDRETVQHAGERWAGRRPSADFSTLTRTHTPAPDPHTECVSSVCAGAIQYARETPF